MGDQTTVTDRQEAISLLTDKTKDVRFAMLTTVGDDGTPRCRPMSTHEVGEDGALWFFTYDDSRKVRDVGANPEVTLGYADPGSNTWVSVSGRADVVRDADKVHELWSAPLKIWFPEGPDDDRIALLRVTPREGEVWDGPSSTIGRAVAFAKTYASNATEPPGDDVTFEVPGNA